MSNIGDGRFDVCVIGHITRDIIKTGNVQRTQPGGVVYYFSMTARALGMKVCVVTKARREDSPLLDGLRERGVHVLFKESRETTVFENIYTPDLSTRRQYIRAIADPFTMDDIQGTGADIFHLGPLTPEDISLEVLKGLSKRATISLDVQGFVRRIKKGCVESSDWKDKEEGLGYVDILKADEIEAEALTGEKDPFKQIERLSGFGMDEIIITRAQRGSFIFHAGRVYSIPAFVRKDGVDVTGCGDTYMAGYIFRRSQSDDVKRAGIFASAVASLKTTGTGPFTGDVSTVEGFLRENPLY